jgi:hypothetical protein
VNAAMEVCAKACNIDAIYGIAAKLPDKGPGAPDHATYTIILECLRVLAERQGNTAQQSYSHVELERLRSEYILQGKRLWADVLSRWRRGILTMDELLVDAMGRLLLLGNVQNFDEVLSLVAQTTNIPREIPAIGDPERQTNLKTDPELLTAGSEKGQVGGSPRELQPSELKDGELKIAEQASREIFKPTSQSLRLHLLATPRNRTLSLLMKACGRMNASAAGQRYWEILTANLQPDLDNFHQYLRILHGRRNSRLAVELVRQICVPKEQDGFGLQPRPVTFRIAMSACVRDGNSPRCLEHVRALLELQSQYLSVPDVRMGVFLADMLLMRSGQWQLEEFAPTMDALDAMWVNLKNFTAYGDGETMKNAVRGKRQIDTEISPATRDSMREMTQSYYRLLENSMSAYREKMDEETFRVWNKRLSRNRNKLNRTKMAEREKWFVEEGKRGKQAKDKVMKRAGKTELPLSEEAYPSVPAT